MVLTQLIVPAAPNIGTITRLPNGHVQITGTGVPNWTYAVEANEDLGDANGWTAIGTAVPNVNGQMQFIDPDAPNHAYRFYRFVAP